MARIAKTILTKAKYQSESISSFDKQIRAVLDHFHDVDWIGQNSPLAAPYFLGRLLAGKSNSSQNRGRVLQALLRQTLDDLPISKGEDGRYASFVLDQRFVHQKSVDYLMDKLSASRPTYYRHEAQAIDQLSEVVLRRINPALRQELPIKPSVLIGREDILSRCMTSLTQRQTVMMLGANGVGKTSLGAMLAHQWHPRPVLWYILRPGINDRLHDLLFHIGFFLSQHGASSLWLQLVADQGATEASVAEALLRADFEKIGDALPLVCCDDVDQLRPEASADHAQILTFMAGLHSVVPILMIGQLTSPRQAIRSDAEFLVPGLTLQDIAAISEALGWNLSSDDQQRLLRFTNGNPRLMRLIVSLRDSGERVGESLVLLSNSQSAEPLVTRIFQNLPPEQQTLVKQLAVRERPAPADVWSADCLALLNRLGLTQEDDSGGVGLLPPVRSIVYGMMTQHERAEQHILAARIAESRGEFTNACRHYVESGNGARAIHLWRTYQELELSQGRTREALSILEQALRQPLEPKDREAATLTCSELMVLLGNLEQAKAALNAIIWRKDSTFNILAGELRGNIALMQYDTGQAIDAYAAEIDAATSIHANLIGLNLRLADAHRTAGDLQKAWRALRIAEAEVLHTRGYLQTWMGHYEDARQSFESALQLAQAEGMHSIEAKIRNFYADLLQSQSLFDESLNQLELSLRYYETAGDLRQIASVKCSLAAVYTAIHQLPLAIKFAEASLQLCETLNLPTGISRAAATLAGVFIEVGDFAQAEPYVHLVSAQKVQMHAHHSLRLQAQLQIGLGQFDQAESTLRQCIQIGRSARAPKSEAYGQLMLAETLITSQRRDEAQQALHEARRIFEQLGLKHEIEIVHNLLRTHFSEE